MEEQIIQAQVVQPATDVRYAGFLLRLIALIIDSIILWVVNIPFGILSFFTSMAFSMSSQNNDAASFGAFAINTLISWTIWLLQMSIGYAYYVIFIVKKGWTPGKKVLNLKVVKEDGSKLTYGDAILREVLGKILSMIPLFLGFFWVIWDPKKQGWHDKISKTIVIKES